MKEIVSDIFLSQPCTAWKCLETLKLPAQEITDFYRNERNVTCPYGYYSFEILY